VTALSQVRGWLPLLLAVAACARSPEPVTSFLGTWTFNDDSNILLGEKEQDGAASYTQHVNGVSVRLTATAAGVDLDLGCRCHIPLTADGGRLSAHPKSTPACELLVLDNQFISFIIDEWIVERQGDLLASSASGFAIRSDGLRTAFSSNGTLAKSVDSDLHCGGSTAIGVVAYQPDPSRSHNQSCPIGWMREGVSIYVDGEDVDGCSLATGDQGEPSWLPPSAAKDVLCTPASAIRGGTWLPFCRVDGDLFRPFAGDGRGSPSYAVLSLGESCPTGSSLLVRQISTEHDNDRSRVLGSGAAHNQARTDVHLTELHFCLFTAPADGEPVQTAFPDLGLPYAVFHDFDGVQPPWVIAKRWQLNDDEVDGNADAYVPADGASLDVLRTMIENPIASNGHQTTIFDLARVR